MAQRKTTDAGYLLGLFAEELRPRKTRSITDWSREFMQVTDGPHTGGWNPDDFPLQRAVVDSICDQRWSKTVLLTGPQTFGKTECAAKPVLLHGLRHRQVSAVYVAASAELASSQWHKKFLPAIKSDPHLADLLFDNPDDGGNRLERRFRNGTSLHVVGSESIGNLSGKTAPIIVCDDVQAYGTLPRGLGHPADYATTRTGSFPAEMTTLVYMGTATTVTDWLWTTMLTTAFYCPFVPCPECGTYQLLEFDRLQYNAEDPEAAKSETWMQCAGCDHQIIFDELPVMLIDALWVSMPPDVNWITDPPEGGTAIDPEEAAVYPRTDRKTTAAGFWSNALYWPWGKTWGEHAAEWISRQGDPDKVRDFGQNVLTQPHEEPEVDEGLLTVDDLARHRLEGYKHCTVPAEADLVTLTVDVHDRYLYYIVRAWEKATGTSWLVDAGHPGVHGPKKGERLPESRHKAEVGKAIREALEELWLMEAEGWPVVGEEGARINAALVLIDGRYRPDAVGQFCLHRSTGQAYRKWCMILGSSKAARPIWSGKPSKVHGRYPYREVGVSEAKHVVRELLNRPPSMHGVWHTYSDESLEVYHRHMVSEEFAPPRKGGSGPKKWQPRKGGGANHWWDCEVYQIAAAIACGVKLPTRLNREPVEQGGEDRGGRKRRSGWKIGR